MSEFDREDQDVISLVRENRRRSGITTHVGYLVTDDQMENFARDKAGKRSYTPLLILSGILLIVTLAVSLAAVLV